jgi:signal transduction histidine kinase
MPEACLAELLLQQSPACHWLMDREGVFLRIYGDARGIFGKTAAELVNLPLSTGLGAAAATLWRSRLKRVFAGEMLRLRERSSGGSFNISVFPVQVEGEVRYAGGLAREVTPWGSAEQELRHSVLGALKAMEFERNMLSKFLHDSIGQNLTALGLQLDLIRMELDTVAPDVCVRIGEMQGVLEEMMSDTREYSYELNPSAVERTGLRAALDRMAARLRQRFPGNLRLNVDPSLKLETEIASAMFHIAQEAVENSVQHSSCSAIEIAVKSSRTGTFLEVKDNGKGFDPGDLTSGRRGLGFLSMEHYAAQAGLELSIVSNPGAGTTVRAETADSR